MNTLALESILSSISELNISRMNLIEGNSLLREKHHTINELLLTKMHFIMAKKGLAMMKMENSNLCPLTCKHHSKRILVG